VVKRLGLIPRQEKQPTVFCRSRQQRQQRSLQLQVLSRNDTALQQPVLLFVGSALANLVGRQPL
jgi:hypothetical protein